MQLQQKSTSYIMIVIYFPEAWRWRSEALKITMGEIPNAELAEINEVVSKMLRSKKQDKIQIERTDSFCLRETLVRSTNRDRLSNAFEV